MKDEKIEGPRGPKAQLARADPTQSNLTMKLSEIGELAADEPPAPNAGGDAGGDAATADNVSGQGFWGLRYPFRRGLYPSDDR